MSLHFGLIGIFLVTAQTSDYLSKRRNQSGELTIEMEGNGNRMLILERQHSM
jgi:hypothetical protein